MNPRKSSTSSDRTPSPRPRYLAVEVAGALPVSPRSLERELVRALEAGGVVLHGRVRIVRWERDRGLLEVDHRDVPLARARWNGDIGAMGPARYQVSTGRTWGTLRKGKQWLGGSSPGEAPQSQPPTRGF